MSSLASSTTVHVRHRAVLSQALSERALARLVVLTSIWFVGGVYLDGWAHNHGKVDSTFFTPWHAVLYAGYGATAGALLAALLRNRSAGLAWRQALPDGYGPSLIGALIFGVAGLGDMVWHILFGIEVSTAALLSPTHLLLATGGALMVSGPLRAQWRRTETLARRWSGSWVLVLLSLTIFVSFITFMTQFAHPFVWPMANAPSRARPPSMDVYVMNADGTTQRRLTNVHGAQAVDPAWSPDGQTLAVVVRDVEHEMTRLSLFDAQGREMGALVSGAPKDEPVLPAWSPDGRRLAYIQHSDQDDAGLYLVDTHGGAPTRLVAGQLITAAPAWSPDAKTIVYSADDGSGNARLYEVDVPSGRVVALSDGGSNVVVASWSPDGTHLAVGSDREGTWQVYVMNADGSGARRLTNLQSFKGRVAAAWAPAWSPDGSRIAFQSDASGTMDIYSVAADGGVATNLTDNPSLDHLEPSWSPDGQHISFAAAGHTQDSELGVAFGVAAILLQAAVFSATVLLLVGRWALPLGSFAFVFGINAVLVSFMNDQFWVIPAATLAGLAADLLARRLPIRVFAFAAPATWCAAYFLAMAVSGGIGWTIHLWAGSIALAGITGLLLSYLSSDSRPDLATA